MSADRRRTVSLSFSDTMILLSILIVLWTIGLKLDRIADAIKAASPHRLEASK